MGYPEAKWIKGSGSTKFLVYVDEDGQRVQADGSPIRAPNAESHGVAIRGDPMFYGSGKCRFRPPISHGRESDSPGWVPDLKCKEAEAEAAFPYVKGKGPASFTSRASKDAYMRRYGFEEVGFEELAAEAEGEM